MDLPPSFTSQKVVVVFVQEYIKLHGFSCKTVTDRDPFFLSDFWKETSPYKVAFSSFPFLH